LEANELGYLGDTRRALRQWPAARQAYEAAISVSDEIGNLESQVEPRCGLAETLLLTGEVDAAQTVLAGLSSLDYPPQHGLVELINGFAFLLGGDPERARAAFSESIDRADERLALGEGEVASWDVKGVASAALAVIGDDSDVAQAVAAFGTARIATTQGLVDRVVALLDLLSRFDEGSVLGPIRDAASGR
jgi:hypothetical protein